MFNPFARFEPGFIPGFRNLKKRYLVLQTFKRENNLFKDPAKSYVIVTHYDNPGGAKEHLNAVKEDKFAQLMDLENAIDRNRLLEMLSINSAYIVYSILDANPKTTKNAIDKIFKYKIQKYISNNTQWRIGREQTVVPSLETTFGELFVILKSSGQTIRVKLEELEAL
ncbi:MAG: hypothetical protein ABI863_07565 [Ginsengibacter sp.]